VNDSMRKLVGYSAEELLAMSVRSLHPVEHLPATPETVRAEAEQRVHVHENSPVRRKDGSVFYADIVNNYLEYSGRPCVIGFYRDITERKRAEEKLAFQSALLEAEAETSPDGIMLVDDNGRATPLNQHLAEVWRMPQEVLDLRDGEAVLQWTARQVRDPEPFIAKV
jgi:two-component system, sporulation sensor kinase E